jgi:hypothetical protein
MDLETIRQVAMGLPEVTEAPHFDCGSFRVRGKIFVTLPPDGRHAHIFVDEQERLLGLAVHPGFAEPLLWGRKVLGLRVALANADPEAGRHWVVSAWRARAPKRLAAAFDRPQPRRDSARAGVGPRGG